MNQQFLDDLQQLENSPEPQVQQTIATSTSLLLNNRQFMQHMETIRSINNPKNEMHNIQKTNSYLVSIEREISSLTKFVKDIYKKRFPEIESVVVNPVQYIKTVTVIQNTKDKLKQKDLSFLSPHQALSVTISISSLHDSLDTKDAAQFKTSCQEVLKLHDHKQQLFRFVQSCINSVCPNLCRLVGTVVASKLVTIAGGISQLANTPACNIQVLGGERGPNLGFGLMTRNHTGVFGGMEMVQKAPVEYQMQLVRMLANKTAIAARVDKIGACPNGFEGDKLRQELLERFQKIQQKGLVAHQKALPIPGEQPKKKRGGKRYRRQKQRMGMTDLTKLQNRMKFNEMQEETIDGVGKGMIKNSGHIRVQIKKTQKLNPSKKMLDQLKRGQQAGIQSTLGFDSTRQMELINPDKSVYQTGTQTYFNQSSGLKTVLQEKLKKI